MNIAVSILTRRNLLDELLVVGNIEGRFEITDFLSRVWPLDEMPATDHRFTTARGDIWQHVINNDDWDLHYLYWDYLKLGSDEDRVLFSFLEHVVHPVVRTDKEDQQRYVEIINNHLEGDGFQLQITGDMSSHPLYSVISTRGGVSGSIKNLIFAADGPKPEIVLSDSVNNEIQIVRHAEYCLVYDRPISNGLLWEELIHWWRETQILDGSDFEVGRNLYQRLFRSLTSDAEKMFFEIYFNEFLGLLGDELPALIPQVYLHYDPYTSKGYNGEKRLPRQRMDFLFLFKNSDRIIVEIDGKHHYSDGEKAIAKKYSEMVAADRDLRLRGYEVYRFGGYELLSGNGEAICLEFFHRLLKKYRVIN